MTLASQCTDMQAMFRFCRRCQIYLDVHSVWREIARGEGCSLITSSQNNNSSSSLVTKRCIKYLQMWDHETQIHITHGTAESIQRRPDNVQPTICPHITQTHTAVHDCYMNQPWLKDVLPIHCKAFSTKMSYQYTAKHSALRCPTNTLQSIQH